jgi:hypothetical protein
MINHGKINKQYYGELSKKLDNIYSAYPDLYKMYQYFRRLKKRDAYYVALKRHAVTIIRELEAPLTLKQVAHIINLKNHATVINLEKNYVKVNNYDEFVKKFDYYIENYLYPLTEKNEQKRYSECFYTLVHIPDKNPEEQKEGIVVGKKRTNSPATFSKASQNAKH